MAADSVSQIGLDLVVNKGTFEKQMTGIQALAKKAGASLAAAFAVKKIVDFGAKCVELGSDLAEVQNVVDVVFPRMNQKINEFAKNSAAQFGLSETMAKKFTGTFGAMAKAFGFGEQQAYEMGTTLTGLAGDVASFYNISQDEAYTKLKSVFTGETESLKDLGIVMTQTALDSYALANGFGKTTAKMSEAEKVALRYKFVQDQLTSAAGDFSRTSDGWAGIDQCSFSGAQGDQYDHREADDSRECVQGIYGTDIRKEIVRWRSLCGSSRNGGSRRGIRQSRIRSIRSRNCGKEGCQGHERHVHGDR